MTQHRFIIIQVEGKRKLCPFLLTSNTVHNITWRMDWWNAEIGVYRGNFSRISPFSVEQDVVYARNDHLLVLLWTNEKSSFSLFVVVLKAIALCCEQDKLLNTFEMYYCCCFSVGAMRFNCGFTSGAFLSHVRSWLSMNGQSLPCGWSV